MRVRVVIRCSNQAKSTTSHVVFESITPASKFSSVIPPASRLIPRVAFAKNDRNIKMYSPRTNLDGGFFS